MVLKFYIKYAIKSFPNAFTDWDRKEKEYKILKKYVELRKFLSCGDTKLKSLHEK